MKVTLISGFLGSGKTSLLSHVLTNKDHKMKAAVIVNEISEFNIDALAVENAQLLKSEEKAVEMSNGCICCTLREDLLEQLNELQESGYDCALIESSGIAEPMQVAETWFFPYEKDEKTGELKHHLKAQRELEEQMKAELLAVGGDKSKLQEAEEQFAHKHGPQCREMNANAKILQDVAPLDNCVTIVDATTLIQHMQSTDSTRIFDAKTKKAEVEKKKKENPDAKAEDLEEEQAALAPEDDHNIATLMFDQLEFANVVVLNKIDALPASTSVESLIQLIQRINPMCKKVIPASFSKVELQEIVNTNYFTEDFASQSQGWMDDVYAADGTIKPVTGESEEYGVTSISFVPKVPFHPERLNTWMRKYFVLDELVQMPEYEMEDTEKKEIQEHNTEVAKLTNEEQAAKDAAWSEEVGRRKKARTEQYGNLFRGKGYAWIGQPRRNHIFANWSQAGNTLSFRAQGTWDEFPQSSSREPVAVDPGQRLVFIGQDLNKEALLKDLNSLLLTPEECSKLQAAMAIVNLMAGNEDDMEDIFPDPFAPFFLAPAEEDMLEEEEENQ